MKSSSQVKLAPSILSADFSRLGQQVVEATKAGVSFILERCPYCWGIEGEVPQCAAFIGLLESASNHFSPEATIVIEESECTCSGSENCVFGITVHI